MTFAHRFVLLFFGAAALCLCLLAQEIFFRPAGDQIRIFAPKLHFLTGKPMERLHDGNGVTYDFQLSIFADTREAIVRRNYERFVFSYDLWEERFSITRMRTAQAHVSHLTASAAEAWCVENMAFATTGIAPDRQLWVRLEIRAQDPKEPAPLLNEPGMSLSNLIDIFSKASRARQPQYWKAEAGPIRLADFKQASGRSGD